MLRTPIRARISSCICNDATVFAYFSKSRSSIRQLFAKEVTVNNVSRRLSASVALFLVSAHSSFALDNYTLIDIAAGPESFAWGINSNGDVVGENSTDQAFLYSNGQLTELPTLSGQSVAFDINDSGQIVGFSTDANGFTQAVLWVNGTITNLAISATNYSRALAINNQGQIVGVFADSNDNEHLFLYEDGVTTDLGALGINPWWEYPAADINDAGVISYFSNDNTSGQPQARLYDNGTITELGTAPGSTSLAAAINNNNVAAGSIGDALASNRDKGIFGDLPDGQAALFDNGAATPLAAPANLSFYAGTAASGINDSGMIVGGAAAAATSGFWPTSARGFVYEPGTGTVDINDIIVAVSSPDQALASPDIWTVVWGEDINNNGAIAANAWSTRFFGPSRAVVLMPATTDTVAQTVPNTAP